MHSADHNQKKLMTLSLDEFLRRFLLHLLPKGFVQIRHFGFLANRRRSTLLPLCFAPLGKRARSRKVSRKSMRWMSSFLKDGMLRFSRHV